MPIQKKKKYQEIKKTNSKCDLWVESTSYSF